MPEQCHRLSMVRTFCFSLTRCHFETDALLRPYHHRVLGEVYVLNDGGEVDLDLGNYERYLNVTLARDNNITTGKVYREVIEREVRSTAVSYA